MATLAIKGHSTRGKEVIQLLEMLGGENKYKLLGDAVRSYYVIEYGKIKEGGYISCNGPYTFFTLEDFEEKFPYKIGDKVTMGDLPCIVTGMSWYCDDVIYYVKGDDFHVNIGVNGLEPYKEENMEEKEPESKAPILSNRYDYAEGKCGYVIPDGYEFDSIKQGVQTEIILKPIKYQYPKDFEKCCDILNIPIFGDIAYVGHWAYGGEYLEKHLDVLRKFQQLFICRNAYWKIAGKEMGLDKQWEPDWKSEVEQKFIITIDSNEICGGQTIQCNTFLAFPTEEMRDAFYENFNNLIKECKELL